LIFSPLSHSDSLAGLGDRQFPLSPCKRRFLLFLQPPLFCGSPGKFCVHLPFMKASGHRCCGSLSLFVFVGIATYCFPLSPLSFPASIRFFLGVLLRRFCRLFLARTLLLFAELFIHQLLPFPLLSGYFLTLFFGGLISCGRLRGVSLELKSPSVCFPLIFFPTLSGYTCPQNIVFFLSRFFRLFLLFFL